MLISKNFKNDTIGSTLSLTPLIVITKYNKLNGKHTIKYAFSNDKLLLKDQYNNTIRFNEILEKITNVKSTTDYDSKKFKISRMRFGLYNYYDINKKLGEVLSDVNTIIGNNIFLYYKTPSTDLVTIPDRGVLETQIVEDKSCALVFSGLITRVTSSPDIINIQAEDSTQLEISDTLIPYFKLEYLSSDLEELTYFEQDETIPMVFGKVDKAPCTVQKAVRDNTGLHINIIHDRHSIMETFYTNPVPNLTSSNLSWIYVKDSDEYAMLDNQPNSRLIVESSPTVLNKSFSVNPNSEFAFTDYVATQYTGNAPVFPELTDMDSETRELSVDTIKYVFPNSVFHNKILSQTKNVFMNVASFTTYQADTTNGENVYNNGNYPRYWYRADDPITYQLNTDEILFEPYGSVYSQGSNSWGYFNLFGNSFTIINLKESVQLKNGYFNMSISGNSDDGDISTSSAGMLILPLDFEFIRLCHQIIQDDFQITEEEAQQLYDFLDPEPIGDINIPDVWAVFRGYCEALGSYLLLDNHASSSTTSGFWPSGMIQTQLNSGSLNSNNFLTSYRLASNYPVLPFHDLNNNEVLFNHTLGEQENPEVDFQAPMVNNYYSHFGEEVKKTTFETDKVALIQCPVFPDFGLQGGDGGFPDDNVTLRTKLHNCAFSTSKRMDILKNRVFASVSGRTSIYYTQDKLFTEDFTIGYDTEEIFDAFLNGANEQKPTVVEYESMVEHIYNEIQILGFNYTPLIYWWNQFTIYGEGVHVIPTEVFPEYFQLTPTGFLNGYDPNVNDIFFPDNLSDFVWNPDSSDDSVIYTSDVIIKNYIIPIYKYYVATHFSSHYNYNVEEVDGVLVFNPVPSFPPQEIHDSFTILMQHGNYIPLVLGLKGIIESTLRYFYLDDNVPSTNLNLLDNELGGDAGIYTFDSLNDIISETTNYTDLIENSNTYFEQLKNIIVNRVAINNGAYLNLEPTQWVSNLANFPLIDINLDELANTWEALLGMQSHQYSPNDVSPSIEKPTDIIMNILGYEMGFSVSNSNNDPTDNGNQIRGNVYPFPIPDRYDIDSINLSRDAHKDWKMGFAINKQVEGKKVFENLLNETKSYMKFTKEGKLGFITIQDSYTYDDIDHIVNSKDVIKYNITKTKVEDVIISSRYYFRYDNGIKKYIGDSFLRNILDYLPDYDTTYYNLSNSAGYEEKKLRYHTDYDTTVKLQEFDLLNNCNQHNIITMELPLSYIMETGSIIHIPLINDDLAFGMNYENVNYVNAQYTYPLWIVMETDIGLTSIKIKAYQLHYLGTDGLHGFVKPDEDGYEIIGNTIQFNASYQFNNGENIPNWNYNPFATTDNGKQIPFFALGGYNSVSIYDLLLLVDHISYPNSGYLSQGQIERLKYDYDGGIEVPQVINVVDIISMVNVILQL